MAEKWTKPLPKKRAKQSQSLPSPSLPVYEPAATVVSKKARISEDAMALPKLVLPPILPEVEEDELAGNPKQDVAKLEQHLQETCFLDPTLGVHEHLQSRDPMLIVLEAPMKPVVFADGTRSTVIDELIKSGDEAFNKSCGSRYREFEMIQYAVQSTLASKDEHAKQMLFLGMLAIDRGLHDQFLASYPVQEGDIRESARFEPFMKEVVKPELDEACNTMYVNVPAPTPFNVDGLLLRFLRKCVGNYPG
jgi:hypothetical protein